MMRVAKRRAARGALLGMLGSVVTLAVQAVQHSSASSSTCTAPNAVIALSPDKAGVTVQAAPEATKGIHFAYMPKLTSSGGEIRYAAQSYPQAAPYVPPAADPVVDAIAVDESGNTLGNWAGRVQTTPPATPSKLATGVVLDGDTESALTLAGAQGAKVVRAEFSIDEPPDALERLISKVGPAVEVQPLIGFQGRVPTAAEAREIVKFAVPGVRDVEFGNETPYQIGTSQAQAYGERAKEAIAALAPKSVGLLVQGGEPSREGPTEWLTGTLRGLGGVRPAGWTVHPYAEATWGGPLTRRLVAGLEAAGDTTTPIYATEWGRASANGVTLSDGTHYTYAEAAGLVKPEVEALQTDAKGRLAQILVYQARDLAPVGSTTNRDEFFGVLTNAGTAKEPYTAAIRGLLGG